MADRRRIVTFDKGNRPVLEVDLEVGASFQAIGETFAYTPGQNNQQASSEPSRYGGQVIVGEQVENGTVTWQVLAKGATPDQTAANIETLLASVNRSAQGRLLEWRPDGNTYSSYFRIAGPGTCKPTYKWAQWQGALSMVVEISFPVRPLVLWDPMTIGDEFDVDSTADYTFDAATSADVTAGAGALFPAVGAALTVERRARHTIRGYKTLEGQVTVPAVPGATITGFKAGVILRATATSYVEVYVDDNGTNSRLRIDVVIAGVRTNRASTNLGARVSNGTTFWVRGRVEGSVVIAEHFTVAPTPMGAPVTTNTYTLSGGEQISLTAGHFGWSWVPQHASATINSFTGQPFTWRNLTLPQTVAPLDAIPGSAPALASVALSPSGGSAPPVWALAGWALLPGYAHPPFGIYEAESFTALAGWASSVQAGARGGNDIRATTSGAGSFSGLLNITDAAVIESDEFVDGQVDLEVWARVLLSSTLVNPRIRVVSEFLTTVGGFNDQDTVEFGAAGKTLVKPSSGTVYRYVRLGTIPLDCSSTSFPQLMFLGNVDTGSTGAFGIDYVKLVPARRRAAMMTGVALASSSKFVPTVDPWTRRVQADLSSTLEQPSGVVSTSRVPGMGGALVTPSAGAVQWVFKLSSLVPDDPTSDTTTEQLAHSATVALDVTPRSYMLRGA